MVFFFFKQKTAYEMRISDWSSDVCSSDLFELAEYGNRIPSLTFEIVADDAPVSAGAIAAELSDGIVDGAGATQMLGGFSAYGDSVRGVLETLAVASGGWFAPAGAHIRFTAGGAPGSGRASGRGRVCTSVLISVVADSIKKKPTKQH